jgi:hypothetical protein
MHSCLKGADEMKINEFDHVRIKKTGVTGIVVDISVGADGQRSYCIEDDIKKDGTWPLYDCDEEDLEKLDD